METISYTLPPEQDGATVRHILKAALHVSSHAISRLTRTENGIRVNGIHARTVDILHTGDVLEVETSDHRPPRVRPTPGPWPLPIVWEDGHLLVVNKPAGMTARLQFPAGHAHRGRSPGLAAGRGLRVPPGEPAGQGHHRTDGGSQERLHPRPAPVRAPHGEVLPGVPGGVHRLSGSEIRHHRRPIGRDPNSVVGRCVRPDGARAVTHYEVLGRSNGLSLLRLRPETGRTHQLRVHMASIGCPLAGDWLYGEEDPDLIPRPALHAYALDLDHPVTGEHLSLTAPIPADMARLAPELLTETECASEEI